ncbi:MAG: FTR1 family protein [Porticoccaceae bacterium]
MSSVTFILQETLEAALIISLLLVIGFSCAIKNRWLFYGLGLGIVGACIYAYNMKAISECFDYVGQELTNAFIQISIVLLIGSYAFLICAFFIPRLHGIFHKSVDKKLNEKLYSFVACNIVALGIILEGSEILVYLNGFFQQNEVFPAVILGSSIGFGLGLSIGIILYYTLANLPPRWRLTIPFILLGIFAGNMASQAALQLTQADWLPYTPVLWNSSTIISESSVTGRLLYALFGYEATPSLAQALAYAAGVTLVLIIIYTRRKIFCAGSKALDLSITP